MALKPNAAARASKMQGGFQLLARTAVPGGPGDLVDAQGKPLMQFGPNMTKGTTVESSVNPDATTLLPRRGDPTKADLFLHFESPLPATVYHLELNVGPDGSLSIASQKPVDWSAWGGVWTPCAGSMSPWGTHLGSEEYEPDARAFYSSNTPNSRVRDHARYYGLYMGNFNSSADFMTAVRKVMSPYKYGYVTEVAYDSKTGSAVAKKWYSMGRVAVEAGLVMPDKKTVYVTDDGRNVGFFKFVADKAGDLRKGRLFAAKFNQTSASNGGRFQVSWVELGRTDQDVLAAALPNTTFADIFDAAAPVNGSCPAGFRAVKHSYGEECLSLRNGSAMLAAAFETRRYASYLGATTEWTKWEGITLDTKRGRLYTAMTELLDGTNEEPTRFGGMDHVRLPPNKCGCVYAMDLDASYSATNMYALTCGIPDLGVTPGLLTNNTCHIDRISSPDNVAYHAGLDLLLIAEDTDHHENNFLWAYDVATGDMTRVMSGPVGAEVTGTAFFTLPVGGTTMTYIWNNLQHPYSGYPASVIAAPEATGTGGYVGYFGPFVIGKGEKLGLQAIHAPTDLATKHAVVSSSKAVIGEYLDTRYHILGRSGQKFGEHVFGQNVDVNGQPVYAYTNDMKILKNQSEISNSPDFTSLTTVCDKVFFTTQFEYANPGSLTGAKRHGMHAARPPCIAQLVDQDPETGALNATAVATPLDWSAWGGLLTPCAGSLSPWGTRMGSEEYEPDARAFAEATTVEHIGGGADPTKFTYDGGNALKMGRFYGLYYGEMNLSDFKEAVKPYLYGFITETKVQYDNSALVQKHYTLGRVATELALVMPDSRTAYITDDGANVGFYKFVADVPGDLSSGNLYAGKFIQVSGQSGGSFRINWIWLAHGTQDSLILAASRLTFADIFATAAPANGTCPAGFLPTNGGGRGCECLAVKPGMEMYAAFFETRRYAGILGATTEWSKWEGITLDAKRGRLYTAISDVRQGMEDNKDRGAASTKWDQCTTNDVRLEYNRCGCVYELRMDGSWNSFWMQELVCGTPVTTPGALGYVAGNRCHMDRISSPDNVAFIPEHDVLIIGEDTSEHQNDVIWAYDMETRALTRIFSTPYGSESTSPYWYGNVNGFSYITAVVQHPYGESDMDKANDTNSFGMGGTAGVIGPFPLTVPPRGPGAVGDYDYDSNPAASCASEDTFVVAVQVSYERTSTSATPAEAARLDAYVCARIDTLLTRLSGSGKDAYRVAVRCLEEEGDNGVTSAAVVARVQLGLDRAAAKAFQTLVVNAESPLRAELARMFAELSSPGPNGIPAAAAFSGFAVSAAPPKRMSRTQAYTPPTERIF
ncbi:hypothetical protein GPECTOR_2g1438 [Gonium pectorale]|uniref:Alkaline phosphatase n=1 Tax=Gonium pectorale TaxID=33097 RepID=A0A150H158_GONPE|nr:hypothetical protein GPECTOR_2g1438 [Gonium pectorale]|eukprot:KXZ55887.1 hypothetical protein GPECTOR_2g1438 [Gonium pectorale]